MLILIINRQIRHFFSNFANFADFQDSKSRNFGDWRSIAKAKFSSPCLLPKSRIWRYIARNANTVAEDFSWKSRLLSPKITKISSQRTPQKSRKWPQKSQKSQKSRAKDLKIAEKSREKFWSELIFGFLWQKW